MIRILSLIALLVLTFNVHSQIIKVVSHANNQPIEDVYVFNSSNSVLTNIKGEADISDFNHNEAIHFQHPSFQNLSHSLNEIVELNYTVSLKSNIFPIEEVVVSAHKWEQKTKEIPVKIIKLKKEEILQASAQTSADLLKMTNQVFIQKSQLGGGSPMIRGFSANRVLLVLDGVRLNNAIYRSGNLQNVLNIDANSLESAEVILGPGSIIYGSDAIGGVMDFHTILPKYSTSKKSRLNLRYKTRYSSANKEIMQHGQYNFGKEKLSFAGGITYSDFSDLKMGKHGPDDYLRKEYIKRINNEDISKQNSDSRKQVHTAYSQLNLLQKIRLKTSDKSEILYNFQYSETSDVPRYDRLIQYSGDQLKYAQWYYGPQKLQFHSIQYENKKENNFYNGIRFNASYQKYQESRHSRKVNSNSLKNRSENLNIFTINLDANKEFSKNTQLYYGSEYTHNSLNSKGFNRNIITKEKTEISSRYPDDSKYSSLAFYTKMTWKINKKLSLNSGLRYSHIWINSSLDNTFYDFPFESLDLSTGALNGGVGITYQTDNKWLIKVNSTTGFRAPNIDDIGKVFDSEPGKVVVPNNNLKAEYIYNFETNISKNFNDLLHIDFGLFYSFLDNAMVRKDYTFNNENTIIYDGVESQVQAIVNADHAKVWGSHITAIVKISDLFSFQSNLSFTKGEYKDGSPLRHAPPLFGNASLSYKRGKFTSKLLFEYNGEVSYKNLADTEKDKAYLYAKDRNGNPYSPAWAILSLQNRFKLTKHLNASVDVENILNKRYRVYSSGISAAGRNIVISLSCDI